MVTKRRRFGKIKRLRSGRYQASYIDPAGLRRNAPDTFETKPEAADWLTTIEADLLRGAWMDPDRGRIKFDTYARSWIAERPGLRSRTIELYEWLYTRYLERTFGHVFLCDIDPGLIRSWRSRLLGDDVSATMIAKAYRLLRAVLMTAVDDDELIRRNPCRIKGAGIESAPERPVLTIEQVYNLADHVPPRYRAMILATALLSLRYGEAIALQRRHVDLDARMVRIRQAYTRVKGSGLVLGPPKSAAGNRGVSIPGSLVPDLRQHLAEHVPTGPTALVFATPSGKPILRSNFNKMVGWEEAVAAIGATGLHFHDLRHTGNTLAADAGASTANLMARMGHDSPRAAMIYQHATSQADREIADALDRKIRPTRRRATTKKSAAKGAPGVRTP